MSTRLIESLENRCFLSAGDLLASFGRQGVAAIPGPLRSVRVGPIAALGSGKVLVGIQSQSTIPTRPMRVADFIRYNADGTVDSSFDGDGTLDTFFSSIKRITPLSDGRFYVLGTVSQKDAVGSLTAGTYVARFRADGVLDRKFGDRGKVRLELEAIAGRRPESTVLTRGGVVVMITRTYGPKGADRFDGVFRFGVNGRPDAGFGTNGFLNLQTPHDAIKLTSVIPQDDGRIVLSAIRTFRRQTQDVIYRLLPDGSPDATFGVNGMVAMGPSSGELAITALRQGFMVQRFIRVSGLDENGGYKYDSTLYFTRLTENGTVNTGFATGGTYSQKVSFDPRTPTAILEQRNEQLIFITNDDTFRLDADGRFDTHFGRVIGLHAQLNDTNDPPRIAFGDNEIIYNAVNGVVAVETRGVGLSPIRISSNQLRLEGTGADDRLSLSYRPGPHGSDNGPFDQVIAYRNNWGRKFPLAGFRKVLIEGGSGDDRIDFDGAAKVETVVIGGRGNDEIRGGFHGTATISGGEGNDTIDATSGSDYVEGNDGDDLIQIVLYPNRPLPYRPATVYGGAGNDILRDLNANYGREIPAHQYFFGGEGDDLIDAGLGNDSLDGGPGRDTLRGGPGDDTLVTDADDVVINR